MGTGEEVRVKVKVNKQFGQCLKSTKRFIVHQGGTRSSKTWSILQYLLHQATEYQDQVFTICRKTLPSLKATALRDFKEIIKGLDIEWAFEENKSELTFIYNNNLFEFISTDQPQKVRGRKRDYLFMNEANEFSLEDFRQLNFRTTKKVILDFNPSDPEHWIYDEIMPRPECDTFISTYKDNAFLDEATIKEIERFEGIDENYWRVYGLGQRGTYLKGQIFKNWQRIDKMPEGIPFYGLDFGFTNDPTACVKIIKENNRLYLQEVFYETGMTASDMANRLKQSGITDEVIYADSAEPRTIHDLFSFNINIRPSLKGRDSLLAGINKLKEFEVFAMSDSKNLWKEIHYYQWELDTREKETNKPKDFMNHAMDAIRYAVYTRYVGEQKGFVI